MSRHQVPDDPQLWPTWSGDWGASGKRLEQSPPLDYDETPIKDGAGVRVMSGPFEGAEGEVFWRGRRLGERRVGVELLARVGHGGEVIVRMFFYPHEVGVIS